MQLIGEALTFDDVSLQPAYSEIFPGDVKLRSRLTREININAPLLSAAMDTVTEARLAIAMAQFPPLSDELLARLDCPDYVLDDPNISLLEKLFDGFVKSDSLKTKRLKDPTVQRQEEKKKGKFFERLKSLFKRKNQ